MTCPHSRPFEPTIEDDTLCAVLALFASGWEPPRIAATLGLTLAETIETLQQDAEAYPDEPLRVTYQ